MGEKSNNYELTNGFYQNCSEPKELYVIEDASHVDLYDGGAYGDKYLDLAADKMDEFFKQYNNS